MALNLTHETLSVSVLSFEEARVLSLRLLFHVAAASSEIQAELSPLWCGLLVLSLALCLGPKNIELTWSALSELCAF